MTTPGYYGINVEANSYRYSGSFVSLNVTLISPGGAGVCGATENMQAGGGSGYMTPSGFCLEHLDAGTYQILVSGSDASSCSTSSLYMMFGGAARVRLLSED